MRLINADALIKSIKECVEAKDANCEWEQVQGLECALECIDEEPTVQPVVHGEWIKTMEGNAFRDKCSECESLYPNAFGYNWCPNCGAKMDKRKGADDERA